MYEKKYKAIPPQVFKSNGTSNGGLTIMYPWQFKAKMPVRLQANTLPDLDLEIKRIETDGTIYVGDPKANIDQRVDISAYTVALNATIQLVRDTVRPTIIADDFERACYEEEPVVAKRVIGVDRLGRTVNWAQDGVVPSEWDDVVITRDLCGNITSAIYYLRGNVVTTLNMTYDIHFDLIEVKQV